MNDFLVRAAALTLREFPAFNSSWIEGRVERYSRVNIGIAVAVEGALLVRRSSTPTGSRSRRSPPRRASSPSGRAAAS